MMKPLNLLSLAAAVLTLCSVPAQAQKTSALPEATSADSADILRFVDVSDTTLAATGTDKRITIGNLSLSLSALNASALTTGMVPTARLASPLQAVVTNSGTLDLSGVTLVLPPGDYGTPAGAGTELQYRNGSGFGAIPGSSWDGAGLTLPSVGVPSLTSAGSIVAAAGNFNLTSGGVLNNNGSVQLASSSLLGWSSTFAGLAASDTILLRDSAGVLALRNGGNPQVLNIYGSYADSSNFSRMGMGFDTNGNTMAVSSYATGSGVLAPLSFGVGNSYRWKISTDGHFLAATDNTYDIGVSGANRPRNIYISDALYTAGFYLTTGGGTKLSAVTTSGGEHGVITLYNDAINGFDRLQFGGITSSFPALKRSGADVEIVGADGSTTGGSNLILSSPNGTRYRITVSNAGVLTATAL